MIVFGRCKMLKKQRKEILILLFIAFFAGILWMGIESNTGENLVFNFYQLCFLGYVFCSGINAILIASQLLKKCKFFLKCIMIIIWPFSLLLMFSVGFISLVPYVIYNIIKIVFDKKNNYEV